MAFLGVYFGPGAQDRHGGQAAGSGARRKWANFCGLQHAESRRLRSRRMTSLPLRCVKAERRIAVAERSRGIFER